MELLDTLILYDETGSAPSGSEILIWAGVILIVSNLIFLVLCSIFGIDSRNTMDTEKTTEYAEWYKNNVSVWTVAFSEILNSSIYSPVAEELAFRFLLLKVICVKTLKLDFWIANAVQSLIFGVMHMSNITFTTQTKKYTYLQTVSAMISGMVSGFVYKQSNSLLPGLIAHMINNGAAGLSEISGYISFRKKQSAL